MLIEMQRDDQREGVEVIDQALLNLVKAIAEVSPGSDLHVILAARLLARIEAAD